MDTKQSPPRGYETADVSPKGVFIFAGALLVSLGLILAGLAAFFQFMVRVDHRLDARRNQAESGSASRVHLRPNYTGPLLQVNPEEDLRAMTAEDAANLNTYGWIDRPAGVVRVPIARAMDLIAERGLPPMSPGLTLAELQRQRAQPQQFGQALRP